MITHPLPTTNINSNPAINRHVLMIRPSQKTVQTQAKLSTLMTRPAAVKFKFPAFRDDPRCIAARDLSP
jgi:hypothetical protein